MIAQKEWPFSIEKQPAEALKALSSTTKARIRGVEFFMKAIDSGIAARALDARSAENLIMIYNP
jgi:hypothetical protein